MHIINLGSRYCVGSSEEDQVLLNIKDMTEDMVFTLTRKCGILSYEIESTDMIEGEI